MNKVLKIVLIVLAVVLVAGGAVFAGFWWGRARSSRAAGGPVVVAPGPGMMGRGFGPGMMDRGFGPGMMDRGSGPRNGFGPGSSAANVQPVTADEATQAAQKFVDGLGMSGLKLDAPLIIGSSAYVSVREQSSGLGAFALIVDPVSKSAHPEAGADVMWNLKYGGVIGAGMMQGAVTASATPATVAPEMPIAADGAAKLAQDYLDKYQPGAKVSGDPIQFYGFYTLQFSVNDKAAGWLSVNGFNGEIMPGMHAGMFFGQR